MLLQVKISVLRTSVGCRQPGLAQRIGSPMPTNSNTFLTLMHIWFQLYNFWLYFDDGGNRREEDIGSACRFMIHDHMPNGGVLGASKRSRHFGASDWLCAEPNQAADSHRKGELFCTIVSWELEVLVTTDLILTLVSLLCQLAQPQQ